MWPFGKRLREQDAVKKYHHWLKRWMLGAANKAVPNLC